MPDVLLPEYRRGFTPMPATTAGWWAWLVAIIAIGMWAGAQQDAAKARADAAEALVREAEAKLEADVLRRQLLDVRSQETGVRSRGLLPPASAFLPEGASDAQPVD